MRLKLRLKRVPYEVYEIIAGKLQPFMTPDHMVAPATAVQCREKVRALKATYEEVKKDKAQWDYLESMRYIFDTPIEGKGYFATNFRFCLDRDMLIFFIFSIAASPRFGETCHESDPTFPHNGFGQTYVVPDPKYPYNGFGQTYVVPDPKYPYNGFGQTYIVPDPKYPLNAFDKTHGVTDPKDPQKSNDHMTGIICMLL